MRKPILHSCVAVLILTLGCAKRRPELSEQEQALASFKQLVVDYVQTFRQSKHEHVFHLDQASHNEGLATIIDVQEGWYKSYSEISGEPMIDVHKTDSLVSPYVGALEFNVGTYRTESAYGGQDTASQANDFRPKPYIRKHVHTYAYQDGAWVLQSRKQLNYDEWEDCPEGE
jgi:hypothetical protein